MENTAFEGGLSLLHALNRENHQAYFVGGCVRDFLLGREIQDFDLCTSASPSEIQEIFPHSIPTGINYGTITVKNGAHLYEITSFRGETSYSDGRRPDAVRFGVSLEEDLTRRDFTINAMAYHPEQGIIDLFSGQNHLKKRVISCVGQANQRFSEDYLRILRGLRFSATLGFTIESDTGSAMLQQAEGLQGIAKERGLMELKKLLLGEYIPLLGDYFAVFEQWLAPENSGTLGMKKILFVEYLNKITKLPREFSLRFAAFLWIFSAECSRFPLSRQERGFCNLTQSTPIFHLTQPELLQKTLLKHGKQETMKLLTYQIFILNGNAEKQKELEALQSALESYPLTSLRDLAVTGKDLLEIGVEKGENLGKMLEMLFCSLLQGEVNNEKESLLDFVKKKLRS